MLSSIINKLSNKTYKRLNVRISDEMLPISDEMLPISDQILFISDQNLSISDDINI